MHMRIVVLIVHKMIFMHDMRILYVRDIFNMYSLDRKEVLTGKRVRTRTS
jgi:hypothetical protein